MGDVVNLRAELARRLIAEARDQEIDMTPVHKDVSRLSEAIEPGWRVLVGEDAWWFFFYRNERYPMGPLWEPLEEFMAREKAKAQELLSEVHRKFRGREGCAAFNFFAEVGGRRRKLRALRVKARGQWWWALLAPGETLGADARCSVF